MNGQLEITPESNKGKSLVTEKQKENYKDDVVKRVQQSNNTLDSTGRKCLEKATKIPNSSQKTCSKSSLPNRVVSVSLNGNKLKARTLFSKVKRRNCGAVENFVGQSHLIRSGPVNIIDAPTTLTNTHNSIDSDFGCEATYRATDHGAASQAVYVGVSAGKFV